MSAGTCCGDTMLVASISFRVGELVDVTELMAMGLLLLVAGEAALGANGSIPSYLGICTGELGQSFILKGYRKIYLVRDSVCTLEFL